MGTYSHKTFRCPFYKSDRRKDLKFILSCDGGIVRLPGRRAFNAFTDRFCCADWQQCAVAEILQRHYEETPGH